MIPADRDELAIPHAHDGGAVAEVVAVDVQVAREHARVRLGVVREVKALVPVEPGSRGLHRNVRPVEARGAVEVVVVRAAVLVVVLDGEVVARLHVLEREERLGPLEVRGVASLVGGVVGHVEAEGGRGFGALGDPDRAILIHGEVGALGGLDADDALGDGGIVGVGARERACARHALRPLLVTRENRERGGALVLDGTRHAVIHRLGGDVQAEGLLALCEGGVHGLRHIEVERGVRLVGRRPAALDIHRTRVVGDVGLVPRLGGLNAVLRQELAGLADHERVLGLALVVGKVHLRALNAVRRQALEVDAQVRVAPLANDEAS